MQKNHLNSFLLDAELKPRPSLTIQLLEVSLRFRCGTYPIDGDLEKVLVPISINRNLEIWRFFHEMEK